MKHLFTILQVLFWLLIDLTLFIFHLKWGLYLNKWGHSFKKKNGIVSYASNYEKGHLKTYDNKYKAAFFLK